MPPVAKPPSAAAFDPVEQLRAVAMLSALAPAELEHLARAVTWVELAGGTVLFDQGDPPDAVYFLLGGRVKVSVAGIDGTETTIAELGRGEPLGEIALLASVPRSGTVTALRDCTLARLSVAEFEQLVRSDPGAVLALSRTLAERLVSREHRRPPTPLTTIGVVSLVGGPHRQWFIEGLCATLGNHRRVVTVNEVDDARLRAVIESAEADGSLVVADLQQAATPWAKGFLRQSDRVLVLADGTARSSASGGPDSRDVQATMAAIDGELPRELVMMHPSGSVPSGTSAWLDGDLFPTHHHLRLGHQVDLARLARHLVGRSVCLVLGGGGARAFAHIGAYRALCEAGIPVDRVGGSSIGAVIAAQIGMGMSPDDMHHLNDREWRAARINRRLTLPLVSFLSVRAATAMFERMYGDRALEDLWLPTFTTTVDLHRCRLVAHRHGGVARWVRASASPPAIWPPVLDDDGSLHVDGGVLDNLPVRTMAAAGPGRMVTVNVSPYQPMSLPGLTGATVGPLLVLRQLVAARARHRSAGTGLVTPFPNIGKILYRTMVVTSLDVQAAARASSEVYIEPDLGETGLTDYDLIDRIVTAGYDATRRTLDDHGLPLT